jgi:hypothetical protein
MTLFFYFIFFIFNQRQLKKRNNEVEQILANTLETSIETEFDTEFTYDPTFLWATPANKQSITSMLISTHLIGFLALIQEFASHPIGKITFRNAVKKVHW